MLKNKLLKLFQNNAHNPVKKPVKAEIQGGEATVYVYDVIVSSDPWGWGGVVAKDFIDEINALDVDTIHLRINTPGGEIFAARSMEAALREHKARVIVHIDGLAASSGSFLAMAGDEIEISEGGFFMIHRAWTWGVGNSKDFERESDVLGKIDLSIAKSYAKRADISSEEALDMMDAETWIDSEEAVSMGFADRVSGEAVQNAWDLSVYDNAPSDGNGSAQNDITIDKIQAMIDAAINANTPVPEPVDEYAGRYAQNKRMLQIIEATA